MWPVPGTLPVNPTCCCFNQETRDPTGLVTCSPRAVSKSNSETCTVLVNFFLTCVLIS